MTRTFHHLARHWPAYLAFAVLLVMVGPVAHGLITCARQDLPGCPREIAGVWR